MEFGVAADAYRSDPSKKATRNGVIALQIIVAAIVFVLVVAGFYLATNEVGIVSLLVAALAALAMLLSFHIALEWERAVVLRFGRFTRVAGPGVFFTIPLVEYCALRVDQRMMVTPFGAEETLTSDLIPLDVDAVLSWMIWNPELACTEVEDCHFAVALAAQTALRDAIGRAPVSEVVVRRNQLDHELRTAIEEKVSDWGITVVSVEVRDIIVPAELQSVLSLEAQAERRRNARIMLMEAEKDVSELLSEVSDVYRKDDIALELRKLHLIHEGIYGNDSAVVVPSSYSEGFASPSGETGSSSHK
ncbi:slipin family protein [Eggerthella sp. NSJ-70]|uniref:Slipin family protein n=2 Tax=Eggerthella hominis TaxID=2763043 RepID=A0ABR7BSL3_9ACTN|nr:slipin family protein [Eggerthella hominis]